MAMPGTETVRFRRPTTGPNAVAPKEVKKDQFGSLAPEGWKRRHQGLLQDLVGRQSNGPMLPSFSLAVRLLLLVRTAGAMYTIIADCDEVFNFLEPLHYFQHNWGFQTWELSPQYAIRSWAYILLHWPLSRAIPWFISLDKRQEYFVLRILLGAISSVCEARFYRTVVECINERVGRYLFFAMLLSAGMWSASVSFLPSSFAMYTTALAASFWFHPATSTQTGTRRAYLATASIALGAIVGWPFSAIMGLPFLLEQLFLTGGEIAVGPAREALRNKRWDTMGKAIALSSLIAVPVFLVDSWAYGRTTFPTLNILYYNLLSPIGGPNLYGTSPASFYLYNLFVNFNFLLPLALASLPALAITYRFDFRRLGKTQQKPAPGETSPYTLLSIRLSPFYLWLAVMTLQQHKEERFMFPAYPLLCFNAAVTVFLIKGWLETIFIHITASPYRASRTKMFSWFTLIVLVIPCLLSVSRMFALFKFYHAPFDLAYHLQYNTVPTILSSLGYQPIAPPAGYEPRKGDKVEPEWDYSPLATLDPPIRLCYGNEWHRYPGSYLIPTGIEVSWIQSEYQGLLPRQWEKSAVGTKESKSVWPRTETRVVREGRFNGLNRPSLESGAVVPVDQCNYLVALSLPSQQPTDLEPDYTVDPAFTKEFCTTFLDAKSSKWWSRLLYLPFGLLDSGRVYGEYCLMRRR